MNFFKQVESSPQEPDEFEVFDRIYNSMIVDYTNAIFYTDEGDEVFRPKFVNGFAMVIKNIKWNKLSNNTKMIVKTRFIRYQDITNDDSFSWILDLE